MATTEQFREARKVPFQPFRFRMVDGSEYRVEHADWIALPPTQRGRDMIFYEVNPENANEYRLHLIDIALVTDIIPPHREGDA